MSKIRIVPDNTAQKEIETYINKRKKGFEFKPIDIINELNLPKDQVKRVLDSFLEHTKLINPVVPKVDRKIKLNLGAGHQNFGKDFIHIDLGDYPHLDYRWDIGDLSMFSDNSVDYIYSRHSLEYFDEEEGILVLKEWHRVLKLGGILELVVPDFEKIVRHYLKHRDSLDDNLGCLFGRAIMKTPRGEEKIYHKIAYDFVSLKRSLRVAGFKNVHQNLCEGLELQAKAQKL